MSVTDRGKRFGLIGHPLGHSLSPYIHNSLMQNAGIDANYELIDIEPGSFLTELPRVLAQYRGLNCTIPYKERIISLLDSLDEQSAVLRSVNTILNSRGYNTDREGFLNDGPVLFDRDVMILGAGGVSRMLAFAAAGERAAQILVWARRPEQSAALAADVLKRYPEASIRSVDDPAVVSGRNWVLLQGTPAGMWPATGGLPLDEATMNLVLKKTAQVYDTIYNPAATRLVLKARSMGIPASGGLGMLFGQALAAQKIWHPAAEFSGQQLQVIRSSLVPVIFKLFPVSLVLTGFMGSGKSTIGSRLSQLTGLPLVDLDSEIEKRSGRSISQIFSESGEGLFRKLESQLLSEFLSGDESRILATGGGALLSEQNQRILQNQPALTIYLDCSLPEIKRRVGHGHGRPLWRDDQADELQKLYDNRQSAYRKVADRIISADQDPDLLAASLAADFGFGGNDK